MSPELSEVIWQPTAEINTLRLRAQVLAQIRQFFAERSVMEVETPLLSQYTITDQHIASFCVQTSQDKPYYLQTSPEYAMKRLLAAGSGCIFQLGKAFRASETGYRHNPEFTMLEWYRLGFNHHDLMDEVESLIHLILNSPTAQRMTYADLFNQFLNIDIHKDSDQDLQHYIKKAGWIEGSLHDYDRDTCLQIIMDHALEPSLGQSAPLFVYDFPATQAALARISHTQPTVAERFELYIQGVEIANGFHELTDSSEQEQRFIRDQNHRRQRNETIPTIDPRLLAALAAGLPQCSGVALGIDRLMMIKAKALHINEVLTFPWHIA